MLNDIGYARVSTKGQNKDRQLIAMRDYGINHQEIYVDKQSGKDNIGDVHNTGIYFTDGSVEYLLNGRYSKFAVTIGLPYKSKDEKKKEL